MSDHLDKVLIVGTSPIAEEHAKALGFLAVPVIAVGRDVGRAAQFSERTGVPTASGGVEDLLQKSNPPGFAIICTAVSDLGESARVCLRAGVRRILIEKPGGVDLEDLIRTQVLSREKGAEVFVGYNRRFYPNVRLCQEMVAEDGGVLSFHFDFTELGPRIGTLNKPADVLAMWFEANSTHVVDLAFFLGGEPAAIHSRSSDPLAWHPRGGVFVGHGVTEAGASFSYHANWHAPGRWCLDVRTRLRRFLFSPLETLRVQQHGSFDESVAWESRNELCKLGFREQLEEFVLATDSGHRQMTLDEQIRRMGIYSRVCG